MTDIVEQAARKVFEHQIPLASDKPRDFDDPKFLYERNKAFDTAQALADAGLLAEPARTVPTREELAAVTHLYEIDENDHLMPRTRWEIADAVLALIGQRETKDVYELAAERIGTESTWTVDAREALGLTRTESSRIITDVQDLEMSLDRVVIRDADGDIYERQGELETERGTYAAWLGTHNGIKPSPDIRLPATVIYVPGEIVGDRPTQQEVWQEAFSAGYMDGQSHTVPTREELVEAVSDIDAESWPNPASTEEIADAILALMAGQPTVAEAEAQALEEFAEIWATGEWSDWFLAENVTCDVTAVQATDKALRERAQQIRDGK